MHKDFDKGIINFIVAKPLSIIQEFDLTKLTSGYKAKWPGITADNLLVLTHKKANINNFSSVKNKHLSLLINDPISEIFVNNLVLETFDLPAKQIFKKIEFMTKSNQLILNLFFQKTDVILIYKGFYELASELNPQIKNNTQIIARLPNLPRSLGFFHASVEATLREQVLTEIENLKKSLKVSNYWNYLELIAWYALMLKTRIVSKHCSKGTNNLVITRSIYIEITS